MAQPTSRFLLSLVIGSGVSAVTAVVVSSLAVVSLLDQADLTKEAVSNQIEQLEDASAFEALLYQKGFVTEYVLTRDRQWLAQLDQSRAGFEQWLVRASQVGANPQSQEILRAMKVEYEFYDENRRRAVTLADSDRTEAALALLKANHAHISALRLLCRQFGEVGRREAEATLVQARDYVGLMSPVLIAAGVIGVLASVAVGYLLSFRVARPIERLQRQVETASEKARVGVEPGRHGLDGLGARVGAIVRKLDDTSAELEAQRRRMLQAEKLSAMGALGAKLAHEILNPLAGMKAAVQLLAQQADANELLPAEVKETAVALYREATRLGNLVDRLIGYARPLEPHVESCSVREILDSAVEVSQKVLTRRRTVLVRDEAQDIPALEVDRLLICQAVSNLLTNAAQATEVGGRIELAARRTVQHGRDAVAIDVIDEGVGMSPEALEQLFQPFYTTKSDGHGLGLALSHNIVLEHGGHITGVNREIRGAVFSLILPVERT